MPKSDSRQNSPDRGAFPMLVTSRVGTCTKPASSATPSDAPTPTPRHLPATDPTRQPPPTAGQGPARVTRPRSKRPSSPQIRDTRTRTHTLRGRVNVLAGHDRARGAGQRQDQGAGRPQDQGQAVRAAPAQLLDKLTEDIHWSWHTQNGPVPPGRRQEPRPRSKISSATCRRLAPSPGSRVAQRTSLAQEKRAPGPEGPRARLVNQ